MGQVIRVGCPGKEVDGSIGQDQWVIQSNLKIRGYILGVINPHKILTFDPNPPGTCFLPGDIFMVWQVFKKGRIAPPTSTQWWPKLATSYRKCSLTRWWFQFFFFTPKFGEDSPNLTSIFFKWVGSTTNQLSKSSAAFWNAAGSRKILPNKNRGVPDVIPTWIPQKTCQQDTMIIDTVDGSEIRLTCWYGSFIPLFTGFCTSQVVVWDFFHQQ